MPSIDEALNQVYKDMLAVAAYLEKKPGSAPVYICGALNIPRPRMDAALKVMENAELVTITRCGNWDKYSLRGGQ